MNTRLKWEKRFFTLLTGQAISIITSGILQMAIIFYLTNKTGSALVLSLATLAGFLPQALLGPFIGVWVDRWSRKLVMIAADLFIAIVGGMLAIAALFMELPVWLVLLVLFLRSIGSAFHTPAMSAVTPLIVPADQLTKSAGFAQAIQSIGYIVSPAGGALLFSVWPMEMIIALDIVGAVIASITVAMVSIPKPNKSEAAVTGNFVRELKEGYMALRENKGLFSLLWIGTLYMFVYMPISALYPLMSIQYFGGTAAHAAAAEITFAVGMLVGGIILGVWGGFKKKTLTICLSIFLMGISLAAAGILPQTGFAGFAVCCAVMGFSSPLYGVQSVLYQEKIKPEYLGRVFSLSMSLMSVAMPVGLLFSGMFSEQIGVHRWFLVSGIVIIAISLLTLNLPSVKALNMDSQ